MKHDFSIAEKPLFRKQLFESVPEADGHRHGLEAGFFAGLQDDVPLGAAEPLGEKGAQFGVGLAVLRRGGYLDAEPVPLHAGDLRAGRARDGLYVEEERGLRDAAAVHGSTIQRRCLPDKTEAMPFGGIFPLDQRIKMIYSFW